MTAQNIIAAFHLSPELTTDFNHECWLKVQTWAINQSWNGQPASPELHTTARVLWSKKEILLGFECGYTELDIDEKFDINQERHALWDRDVCEAFIRSPIEPHEKYYREFEVAPTGQWCDLLVELAPSGARMWHDWEWKSGMRTVAEINPGEKIWRAAMAIPFTAFGCAPQSGDIWQANLFRISRLNGQRQYLTYSPTLTEQPNFHVAESFVPLRFI
ncbi:MAG: carbohydrate-binding family 9-like protein [Acidobacteriota bacterium]